MLDSGRIDLVINGYEWTEQRARDYLATRPYYVYQLQLMVRRGRAGPELGRPEAAAARRRPMDGRACWWARPPRRSRSSKVARTSTSFGSTVPPTP